MKFTQVENDPDPSMRNVALFASENRVWFVRLDPVMFGCRVHVQHRDDLMWFQTEYCAGADLLWQQALVKTVIRILEKLPEDVDRREVQKIWPDYGPRPMFRDRDCWLQLCEMADVPTEFAEFMLERVYA